MAGREGLLKAARSPPRGLRGSAVSLEKGLASPNGRPSRRPEEVRK
jgi:hypothetical protein